MANTLTNLIPVFYQALDRVSREKTGFIPNVAKDVSADSVGKDQTIRVPIAPASTSTDISPAANAPVTGSQTIGYTDITISKSKFVPLLWNGEEQKSINGVVGNVLQDQIAQAIRTLNNEVEADIAGLYTKASRAYGTAATTPFASSLADAAQMRKILDDNGAPDDGARALVVDTSAGVNLRSLSGVNTNYASGTSQTLNTGQFFPIFNFALAESAQIKAHTKGAGTGYDFVSAGEAVGQTTLSLEGGTVNTTGIKAGDVVTFGTDTNKYVVNTGITATSGDIVIGNPGLLVAGADATEMTIGGSYTANMAFHKNAIQLVTRAPAMPLVGDSADDAMIITDPTTGISYRVCVYKQFKQVVYTIELAWGCAMVKPEWAAILLG